MRFLLQKIMLVTCLFLMVSVILIVPMKAQTYSPENRFGINSFIANRYYWQTWDQPVAAVNNLGVSWIREEFVWALIEPEQGHYNWGFYDGAFSSLESTDVKVLGILDYSAPWATSEPNREYADKYMPDIAQWEKYVAAVVDRYKDKVDYWQIWNEPNLVTFFRPEPNIDSYIALLNSASRIVRERDPESKVVAAGMSGVDVGYLGIMHQKGAGSLFDIVAVHPYQPFRAVPEESGYLRDLERAQQMGDLFNKPVWLTELGWPTDTTEGLDEVQQAQYLVRAYLLTYLYPRIEKVFWYNLRNDGENKSDKEQNFGILHRNLVPKKSYDTYRQMIQTLQGAYFVRSQSDAVNGIYDLVFKKNDKTIRVAWRTKGEGVFRAIYEPGMTVKSLDKADFNPVKSDGDVYLKLSPSPLYILSGSQDIQQKKTEDIYDFEYVDQSPFVVISESDKAMMTLRIKNTGNVAWVKNDLAPRVMLGTCRDRDRHSAFYDGAEGGWIGANRSSVHVEPRVNPGEIATFNFALNPSRVGHGEYREYFCPVVEGISWMKDMGIYWDVTVMSENGFYDYEYISQSQHPEVAYGSRLTSVISLKNTGTKPWRKGEFNLGTARNQDRASIFADNTWQGNNRIALSQDRVLPGETGIFHVSFVANGPVQKGQYQEYFQPVVDGVAWLKDIGIYWMVHVK